MDVYLLPLDAVYERLDEELARLFPNRMKKAAACRSGRQRLGEIGAAVLLREVLHIGESDLTLLPHGKPICAKSKPFNLSHGGDFAVLAVGERAVGADIEKADREVSDEVAKRMFTPEEAAGDRLAVWTMKEALAKAIGDGLSRADGDRSVLPLLKGEPIGVGGKTYFGQSFLIEGHRLALCGEGEPFEVVFHRPTRVELVTPDK